MLHRIQLINVCLRQCGVLPQSQQPFLASPLIALSCYQLIMQQLRKGKYWTQSGESLTTVKQSRVLFPVLSPTMLIIRTLTNLLRHHLDPTPHLYPALALNPAPWTTQVDFLVRLQFCFQPLRVFWCLCLLTSSIKRERRN